jgi:energy-coupling factor transporter ATP-binding protein EcfA2
MEYKLLGTLKGKYIYFPLENDNKILLLKGPQDSGKSMMLKILNRYFNDHNINSILFTPYQKLDIPMEELEGLICLFKLWNRYYYFDNEYYKYVVKNYNATINELPEEYQKVFVILNIFYLTTIDIYSLVLVDELYSKYYLDISYLLGYSDVKFIFSVQEDEQTNNYSINFSNVINIEQCIREN